MSDNNAINILNILREDGIVIYDNSYPIYKYMSLETVKEVLRSKKLRFTVSSAFNDPFELSDDYFAFDVTKKRLQKHIIGLFQRTRQNMTRAERKRKAKDFKVEDVVERYKLVIAEQKKQYLMFCTSKSPAKTLMWSHYAKSHTGVCLGMNFNPISVGQNTVADMFTLCAKYTNVINPINFFDTFQDSDKEQVWIFKWLVSKSKDWEYEEEVRVILSDLDRRLERIDDIYFDMPFQVNILKEVYFGLRTSNKEIQEVKLMLQDGGFVHTKLRKMEIVKGTYNLTSVDM